MTPLISGDRHAPWIPLLGSGRSIRPLKYVAEINRQTLPETTNPDKSIRYIDISSVNSIGEVTSIETMTFSDAPTRARRIVRHGDTIVSTVRTYLRAVASVPDDDEALVASTGFAVVTPGDMLDKKFLSFWLRSNFFVDEVCARSVGVSYPATNASEVGCIPVPLPPIPTQKTIADFLDRKTAAIDALIEKKQKLLDLLAEKRAALINQAVTKGLDPDVPMKDSGVPWIGEIPAHWEVVPLRLYAKVVDCKHRTPEYIDEGFPIVSTTEVKPGRLDLAPVTRKVGVVDFRDMTENRTPTTGDIIYSRNASLGAAAYVDTDVPFAMGQDVVLITAPGADLLYLSYQLNSMVGMTQVDLACIGSTFKRINVGQIKQFQVCMPPSQEAERIASHLDRQEQRYDALRDRLERHVARLQEYRQALITAAVTGQIDVGGHGEQDGDTMGGERRRKLSSEGSL